MAVAYCVIKEKARDGARESGRSLLMQGLCDVVKYITFNVSKNSPKGFKKTTLYSQLSFRNLVLMKVRRVHWH